MKFLTYEIFRKDYLLEPIVEHENTVLDGLREPLVSALVITYQHERYIRKCLDSVVNQETSLFPVEIILCDDGSTDGTREICIEFANRYPDRIRLFLNSRRNNRAILGKPCGIVRYITHGSNKGSNMGRTKVALGVPHRIEFRAYPHGTLCSSLVMVSADTRPRPAGCLPQLYVYLDRW